MISMFAGYPTMAYWAIAVFWLIIRIYIYIHHNHRIGDIQVEPETWHPSFLTMLFWCHHSLLTPMSFQPGSVGVSFPWHPYLLAYLFLETFSWHFLLTHFFLYSFVFTCFFFGASFCWNCFPLRDLLSWHLLCLEVIFHSHVFLGIFFSWHPFFKVLPNTTKSQYYFVAQSCTKHSPALLCTTKLAQSTSQ